MNTTLTNLTDSELTDRAAAEREIERQRKAPRGYRITSQRLVRRLVSDWEDVT